MLLYLSSSAFTAALSQVVEYVKKVLEEDATSRVILFSQWHSLLGLMANTLKGCEVKCAWAPEATDSEVLTIIL